ncbi:MAG: hypothetical protein IJR91_02095, partial [Ruminococcus sp.]|nr:hypothetical protein [Ruminococcus sp.]
IICLPAFRHITQILLDLRQQACVEFRQSDEKLDGASDAQGSCGVAYMIRPFRYGTAFLLSAKNDMQNTIKYFNSGGECGIIALQNKY